MAREIAIRRLRSGQPAAALTLLSEAAALEDSTGIRSRPPFVPKPVHELFGEVLLQLERPREAAEQFSQSLVRAPRRPLSLLGRARALRNLGNETGAGRCYRTLLAVWHAADGQLPAVVEPRAFLARRGEPPLADPVAGPEPCDAAGPRPH